MNKPKIGSAWSMTLAAVFGMFTFVLMVKADTSGRMLTGYGACELMFIVIATNEWKKYFADLIDFKIHESRAAQSMQQGTEE